MHDGYKDSTLCVTAHVHAMSIAGYDIHEPTHARYMQWVRCKWDNWFCHWESCEATDLQMASYILTGQALNIHQIQYPFRHCFCKHQGEV